MTPTDTPLRVMTFNTANDFVEPMHLIAMLRDHQADIISLVELSQRNAEALKDNLHAEYPHRVLFGKAFDGKGLLSRHPIEHHEMFTLLTARPYIEARLNVGGQAVTTFVVHAPAPNYRQLEVRSAYCEPEIKLLIQRGRLHEPTLYMGDFNFVAQSATHRLMSAAGLTDTFRAAGRGLGLTFPTRFQYAPIPLPLMLRIDYIWATGHFKPLSSQVGASFGSDHLPVISELMLMGVRKGADG
jgi:endonuclease/exonuclease/phosphatase (EEP) superfamily protein YafD